MFKRNSSEISLTDLENLMREYEVDKNGGVACKLLNKKMSEKKIPTFLFNN